MGRPELIEDPRCLDNNLRVANRPLVNGAIDAWLMTLSGVEQADAILREHHIPHAPILTVDEAMAHPHMRERRTVRTILDRIIGDFQVPGFHFAFQAFPISCPLRSADAR